MELFADEVGKVIGQLRQLIPKDKLPEVISILDKSIENLLHLAGAMQEEIKDANKKYSEAQLDLRKALRDLERSRTIAELGFMATGVAHQLNQPVGIVRAAASAALLDVKAGLFTPEELQPLLERIITQTDRMAAIIDRFRERARADRSSHEVLDLNQVIPNTLESNFEEQFRSRGIVLRYELTPTPLEVYANRYELEDVLINLVANARDALEGQSDGEVVVTIWLKLNGKRGFDVRDNGKGVSPDVKDHLFVPFTSTKSTEKGTGIGLYLAREMVVGMGGTLTYDDKYQSGARFVVELPPASERQVSEEQTDGNDGE